MNRAADLDLPEVSVPSDIGILSPENDIGILSPENPVPGKPRKT
jgi:hypothetical protein